MRTLSGSSAARVNTAWQREVQRNPLLAKRLLGTRVAGRSSGDPCTHGGRSPAGAGIVRAERASASRYRFRESASVRDPGSSQGQIADSASWRRGGGTPQTPACRIDGPQARQCGSHGFMLSRRLDGSGFARVFLGASLIPRRAHLLPTHSHFFTYFQLTSYSLSTLHLLSIHFLLTLNSSLTFNLLPPHSHFFTHSQLTAGFPHLSRRRPQVQVQARPGPDRTAAAPLAQSLIASVWLLTALLPPAHSPGRGVPSAGGGSGLPVALWRFLGRFCIRPWARSAQDRPCNALQRVFLPLSRLPGLLTRFRRSGAVLLRWGLTSP